MCLRGDVLREGDGVLHVIEGGEDAAENVGDEVAAKIDLEASLDLSARVEDKRGSTYPDDTDYRPECDKDVRPVDAVGRAREHRVANMVPRAATPLKTMTTAQTRY
jgi:hypothetical protein